jgi:hypothetical protein
MCTGTETQELQSSDLPLLEAFTTAMFLVRLFFSLKANIAV